MDVNNAIPRIEKVAILLIVLFAVNLLFSTLSTPFLTTFFSSLDYAQYRLNVSVATIITGILHSIINIVVAVWMFNEARKLNERPWTWAAFALFFGLMAVVLFYLILVLRELRSLKARD
jgi:hypothetical protein